MDKDLKNGGRRGSFGWEVGRKIIHAFALLYLVIYFFFDRLYGQRTGLLVLVGLLVAGILIEYVRLGLKARIPLISWLWKNFRREKERDTLGAEIFFLLGIIIALAVFEVRVAVAAVLITTFGDLAASLVGIRFGRIRPVAFRGKSVEGSVAALVVSFMVGWLFLRESAGGAVWWLNLIQGHAWPGWGQPLWTVILVMAVVGTLTELIISEIDDNLTITVLAGFAGQIALIALHG